MSDLYEKIHEVHTNGYLESAIVEVRTMRFPDSPWLLGKGYEEQVGGVLSGLDARLHVWIEENADGMAHDSRPGQWTIIYHYIPRITVEMSA